MKTPTTILRAAIAALVLVTLSSTAFAKGKPPGGGGGTPPNPEIAVRKTARNKPVQLILMNADGSNASTLRTANYLGSVDLSPVYDELVFLDRIGTPASTGILYLLRFNVTTTGVTPDNAGPIQLDLSTTPFWAADISPDGEYVLYMGGDTFAGFSVYLRSTDPTSGETPRTILTGLRFRTDGVCWLHAAYPGAYRIALNTSRPEDLSESEVLIFTIDPTEPAESVIPRDLDGEPLPDAVLTTTGKPFTIASQIDSARNSESIVAVASYRDEQAPNTPNGVFIPASRAIQWFRDGTILQLTQPFDQGVTPRNPKFSPDDTKLLYGKDGNTVVRNLSTGTETTLPDGTYPEDWAPADPTTP